MMTLGLTLKTCLLMIEERKYRSIFSVMSKSAITPSLSGRTATIPSGVRPNIRFASSPIPFTSEPVDLSTATTEGSFNTIPSPRT